MLMAGRLKIAYYGEEGSYSEQAAIQHFGNSSILQGYRFLPEIFDAVKNGTAYGIVPIENSTEGPVTQTYDLLLESNLTIVGEVIVKIDHCLIANPGIGMKDIRTVYSHPQALGQCRSYIEKHGFNSIPFYDTAGSVKMIKEKKLNDSAAVASSMAASVYKMKVLARSIQSNKRNFTRFIVMAKKNKTISWNKTSIAFGSRHKSGSLFHALNCFAKNGINLLYIESRPIIGRPWEYNFYIDCEGSIKDKKLSAALKELRKDTTFVKILGSYKSARRLSRS
jgi:prephenate dehydratase